VRELFEVQWLCITVVKSIVLAINGPTPSVLLSAVMAKLLLPSPNCMIV